jgi:adenosylhomocysteine nucleosidase
MATSSGEPGFKNEASTVLIAAALRREFAPLVRNPLAGLALVETGEGTRNAGRALRSWLEKRGARAVINIGMAGALSPLLRVGDIVVAREVRNDTESFDASASPLFQAALRIGNARPGVAITVDEIVCEAEAKRRLAERLGASEVGWVDMESAAIASASVRLNVPFLVVRCISDALDEDLPLDFNRCRNSDGRVSPRKVIRSALLRPRAFKGLFELRRRSEMCAERLADFIRELLPHVL